MENCGGFGSLYLWHVWLIFFSSPPAGRLWWSSPVLVTALWVSVFGLKGINRCGCGRIIAAAVVWTASPYVRERVTGFLETVL